MTRGIVEVTNELLLRFAAVCGADGAAAARLDALGRRFARSISEPVERIHEDDIEKHVSVTLTVASGLHRGASLELHNGTYFIGSDAGCDIVLRDKSMAPRHARIHCRASGCTLHDVRAESPTAIAPVRVSRTEGMVRSDYEVEGIVIALAQRASEAADARAAERYRPRPARFVSWTLGFGAVLSAVALATTFRWNGYEPTIAKQIVGGSGELLAQHFDAVRFRQSSTGDLEIAGWVADSLEQQRLREWLARSQYKNARFSVQPATVLIDQVRDALAAPQLQLALAEGGLLIRGETRDAAVKQRIQGLARELADTLVVHDRVAYTDAGRQPGPMPVKVRDVMIGNPGYFRTADGARYFEGSVLPDGAEVLAIEPARIRLRLSGAVVVYDLE